VSGSRSPIANRSISFATWNPSASYIVIDQNASTGGRAPASKWMV
jgi:hypothetical protein